MASPTFEPSIRLYGEAQEKVFFASFCSQKEDSSCHLPALPTQTSASHTAPASGAIPPDAGASTNP
jgi:hypothetical protein